MGRVKRLNSKVNAKQKTNADLPLNPKIVSTFEYTAVTTASQTVITLPFSVEQITNVKKNFEVIIDGAHLVEGASNDYQFTNIAPNNTKEEIDSYFKGHIDDLVLFGSTFDKDDDPIGSSVGKHIKLNIV